MLSCFDERNLNTKKGEAGGLLAGEADWLWARKYCILSAGKSPRAIIQNTRTIIQKKGI